MVDLSVLNTSGYEDLYIFIESVINFAVYISALVTVVSIVISGFKFMLSAGDEDKIKSAQKSLVFSLLGLVLVFLAPTIIQFVIDNIAGA
jgi:heme O synthase-like polyprenyltransferase